VACDIFGIGPAALVAISKVLFGATAKRANMRIKTRGNSGIRICLRRQIRVPLAPRKLIDKGEIVEGAFNGEGFTDSNMSDNDLP
jgi:hypothetical protein